MENQEEVNQKAAELAENMDFDFFDKKLQDEVRLFKRLMDSNEGKDLSKNELRRLLEFAVRLPDIDDITITPKMAQFCEVINNAKYSFLAMNVQYLIEEGENAKQQDVAPLFEGEEDGE